MGIALLVLASLSAGPEAWACSCRGPSYAEAVSGSAFVFEGRLVASTLREADRELIVEVTRVVKGRTARRETLRTATSSPACGWDGEVGETYRFGSGTREKDGSLRIGRCRMFVLNGRSAPPLAGVKRRQD